MPVLPKPFRYESLEDNPGTCFTCGRELPSMLPCWWALRPCPQARSCGAPTNCKTAPPHHVSNFLILSLASGQLATEGLFHSTRKRLEPCQSACAKQGCKVCTYDLENVYSITEFCQRPLFVVGDALGHASKVARTPQPRATTRNGCSCGVRLLRNVFLVLCFRFVEL